MPRPLVFVLGFGLLVLGFFQEACQRERTRLVTLNMNSRRDSAREVSLHARKGNLDCSLTLSSTQGLQSYVENYGTAPVPVLFKVSYDSSGKPRGASLIKIGDQETNSLQQNEKLLRTTVQFEGGQANSIHMRVPGDCFEAL